MDFAKSKVVIAYAAALDSNTDDSVKQAVLRADDAKGKLLEVVRTYKQEHVNKSSIRAAINPQAIAIKLQSKFSLYHANYDVERGRMLIAGNEESVKEAKEFLTEVPPHLQIEFAGVCTFDDRLTELLKRKVSGKTFYADALKDFIGKVVHGVDSRSKDFPE